MCVCGEANCTYIVFMIVLLSPHLSLCVRVTFLQLRAMDSDTRRKWIAYIKAKARNKEAVEKLCQMYLPKDDHAVRVLAEATQVRRIALISDASHYVAFLLSWFCSALWSACAAANTLFTLLSLSHLRY